MSTKIENVHDFGTGVFVFGRGNITLIVKTQSSLLLSSIDQAN